MSQQHFQQVGFVQFAIVPADPTANLNCLRQRLEELQPAASSLLVLPELWATGFVYPQLAELSLEIDDLLQQLQILADKYGVTFAGSLPERVLSKGKVDLYNTLFVSDSNGVIGRFRKQHLFSLWNEDQWFTTGENPLPVVTSLGLIAGLVCFDLRFPETARVQCQQGADILVVSAQWPEARIEQWRIMLRARAIENQIYVVACNGVGMCNDIELGGHSLVIDPAGEIVAEGDSKAQSSMIQVDWSIRQTLWERFNTVACAPWSVDDTSRVISLAACKVEVERRKGCGQKIVFTNGCFDIIHAGHVAYLQQARRQGDFLVVGLNSDSSIRSIKGEGRPVNEEQHRARVLAALGCVDAVVLFSADTPLHLITTLLPRVLVKGADWQEEDIVGALEVKAAGGIVVRVAFETDTSTTAVIEKMQQL